MLPSSHQLRVGRGLQCWGRPPALPFWTSAFRVCVTPSTSVPLGVQSSPVAGGFDVLVDTDVADRFRPT